MAEVLGVGPLWLMGFDVDDLIEATPIEDDTRLERIIEYYKKMSDVDKKTLVGIARIFSEKEQ